ncbi:MAG: hypothetical protein RL123_9, partial [Pseudomonadota bacterium]
MPAVGSGRMIAAAIAVLWLVQPACAQVFTKQYDDGSVYTGETRNGLQHGKGT